MSKCKRCSEIMGFDHECDSEDVIAKTEERMSEQREREITAILNGER